MTNTSKRKLKTLKSGKKKPKKNPRAGKCISSAYDDFVKIFGGDSKHSDALIVHGWVYSDYLKANIKHAWIELDTGYIYEPVSQCFLTPKQAEQFKMRPVNKYNYEQILALMIRTKCVGGKFEF